MLSSASVRILHVVDSLRPGGMENGVVNVAQRLAGVGACESARRRSMDTAAACTEGGQASGQIAGYQIGACCLGERGSFAERMPWPEDVFALEKSQGFHWSIVRQLSQLMTDWRPDIVHSHNLGPLIYASLASRLGGSHAIVHGEHGALDPENLRWKRLLQRRILYRSCAAVHTVSPSLLDDLQQAGLTHRFFTTVRNGVNTERFLPASGIDRKEKLRRKLMAGEPSWPGPMIGIVGRFGAFKGHQPLIEAVERLADAGAAKAGIASQAKLVVAGDGGALRDEVVERMQCSRHRDRILWTGHCEAPEELYPALDLMVFPSSHEGLSNAVLEAMSSGIPVLASNACGNDEVITSGKNGWLEDLSSAEKIARHLQEKLASVERLQAVGEAARSTVETDFSLGEMAAGYSSLYQEVLERRQSLRR